MAGDNVTLNAGSGGATLRTLADGSGDEWPTSVVCYATTVSPGANVLQVVTAAAGLPVAQQGTWNVGVTGSVAVTGTFWQATQPVSAASLPLPAGAATSARQPAIGTAGSAAADVLSIQGIASMTAVKVDGSGVTQPVSGTVTANAGTGTWNVSAAQSGTWNIGTVTTVSAVTAISNPLPAGTNLLGQVAGGPQIAAAYNGATAVTPQVAAINVSASGTTTIVAGVAGKKVYVLRWSVRAAGNVTINWQDTASNVLSGPRPLTQYASDGGAYCPASIYQTATGAGLVLNLNAAIAVGGELTYVQF